MMKLTDTILRFLPEKMIFISSVISDFSLRAFSKAANRELETLRLLDSYAKKDPFVKEKKKKEKQSSFFSPRSVRYFLRNCKGPRSVFSQFIKVKFEELLLSKNNFVLERRILEKKRGRRRRKEEEKKIEKKYKTL